MPYPGLATMIYRPYDNSIYLFGVMHLNTSIITCTRPMSTVYKYTMTNATCNNNNNDESRDNDYEEWEIVAEYTYCPLMGFWGSAIYSVETDRVYFFGMITFDVVVFDFSRMEFILDYGNIEMENFPSMQCSAIDNNLCNERGYRYNR